MTAIVLTAGLATRLRPLSLVRAKPALPVAGVPLVERIVRWLAASGVTDVVLNLHYLPETITTVTGDGSHLGVRIRYSWEPVILGSGGGPRKALSLLDSATFLIVNGDTLTDVDVKALCDAHTASSASITMALVPNRQPEKYGGVIVDDESRVVGFRGKGEQGPSFHFIGVQVASADAFGSVPPDVPVESVVGLYRELLRTRPGSIRACVTEAAFFDIGTPADYLETSLRLAAIEGGNPIRGARVRVAPSARVTDSIIWDDVHIGDNAIVDRCVLTDGVRIPPGATLSNVMVGAGFEATPI